MSKIVAAAAIHGSHAVVAKAERSLNHAAARHGEPQEVEFPGTAFHLPVANALPGLDVTTLGRAREVLDVAGELLTSRGRETGQ